MNGELAEIPAAVLAEIDEALATWDREAVAERARRAEELRLEFLERFPLSSWPDMPLESYALGQVVDGGTVGWWLEFKTLDIGSMSGGSAFKHLIFMGANGKWRFPKQYASAEEAWSAVRAAFVECFELAAQDQFDEIVRARLSALYGAPALRTKALYMYFPEKFIPVCSFSHLQHFLGLLGQYYDRTSVIRSNRTLLQTLRSIEPLRTLNNQELMYFLYHWADPRSAVSVYKIAPGEQARYWDDCLREGYICVGWDAVGDLSAFVDKEEFRQAFSAAYASEYGGSKSTLTRKGNELWTLMTLEPGDRIIANRGISEVLGIGTVTETGYHFDADRPEYQHTLAVDWDTSVARRVPPTPAWATTTVSKVSATQYRTLFGSPAEDPIASLVVDEIYLDVEQALQRRGQVILYGPPGTGKTHYARRAAVWFLEGGSKSATAATLLADDEQFAARERRLSTSRQSSPRVWFVVANPQHWSWDRLFEDQSVSYSFGRLQRNYQNVRAGDLVVGYESTPTKRIVALARVTGEYDPTGDPASALSLEPITTVKSGLTYDELRADPILAQSEPMRFRCQGSLFALTSTEAERLLVRLRDADPGLAEYAEPGTPPLTRVTFHPSYTYEDFIEGFRPSTNSDGSLELRLVDGVFKRICAAAAAAPDKRYMLLIDEINRGNIAKIFGELITLIEDDKRGLTVRLPQSGDEFAVPRNVFVIATMNTADRSIQLLDAALRRRFRFIELMPDSDALEGAAVGGLSLSTFLDTLNDRIRKKVGRERQIGHAVFFQGGRIISTPEEFGDVFRHELLPLVQEYLYDSYRDLAELLGADIVDSELERVTDYLDDPAALCTRLAEAFDAQADH